MASDAPVVPSINLEPEERLKQLADFGNALLDPPTSNIELLALLEEFELFLSGISQSPGEIVISSLGPSKKALIADQILRNPDTEVQIAVLCCINEITRITANEWPYEDKEMKEFFLLFVQSLGRLPLLHDHCYGKVMSILYIIARVRSCVIMLDLQMEDSILEMFGHFLTTIQSRPSPDVFADMVTIMTLLIKEYCDDGSVPVDLLSVLLTSVKNDKKDILPMSWALGEQILQKSAQHIGPSLAEAVQSMDINISDYAEIVASICQKTSQVENMVDQVHAYDSAGPMQIGQLVDGPSKSVDNKSTTQDTNNGVSSEQNSLNTLQFGNQKIVSTSTDNATRKHDDSPSKDENSLKDLNSGPIKVQKTTDLRTISEAENINMTVPQEHNHSVQGMDYNISSEQNTSMTLQFGTQTTQSPLTDNVTCRSDVSPLQDENFLNEQISGAIEVHKAIHLETFSEAENVNVTNAVPQENNPSVKVPRKRERKPNSLFGLEEGYRFTGMTDENGYPELSGLKNSRRKSNRLSDRKSNTLGHQSFPDENLCRKGTMMKKDYLVNQDDPEQKQSSQVIRAKRGRGKSAIPGNCDEESALQTLSQFEVLSSNFTNKQAPKSQHKRKSSSSMGEASRMTYGEKLVGCKIKVWWPMDQEYYEGTVDFFNCSTMKHKVIYDDGDEEILNLMGEDWQLVKDAIFLDELEKVQGSASSDLNTSDDPPSKKIKENNDGEDTPEVPGVSMDQVEN